MTPQFVRSRWAAAAIASLLGACGKVGYESDLRGDPSDTVGSSGSYVVGTGDAGTPVPIGDPTSAGASTQGAGGTGAGGDASLSVGGASGATGGTGVTGTDANGGSSGAEGSAGAGTSGGGGSAVVDAGNDAAPSAPCDDTAPVGLYYRRLDSSLVHFAIKVENQSRRSISLRDLSVRYFLTNETSDRNAIVTYGDICCPDIDIRSRVNVAVVAMASPTAKADTYLEITFDGIAGNLDPNHAVEVQVALGGISPGTPDQSNDYSYIPWAITTPTQWNDCPTFTSCPQLRSCTMTVLVGGALAWGTPP